MMEEVGCEGKGLLTMGGYHFGRKKTVVEIGWVVFWLVVVGLVVDKGRLVHRKVL